MHAFTANEAVVQQQGENNWAASWWVHDGANAGKYTRKVATALGWHIKEFDRKQQIGYIKDASTKTMLDPEYYYPKTNMPWYMEAYDEFFRKRVTFQMKVLRTCSFILCVSFPWIWSWLMYGDPDEVGFASRIDPDDI